MEKGAWYEVEHILWKESQWMVMDKFSEHDITLHIDDGWPGDPTNGGGEYLQVAQARKIYLPPGPQRPGDL